jgi:hypothetical protein
MAAISQFLAEVYIIFWPGFISQSNYFKCELYIYITFRPGAEKSDVDIGTVLKQAIV